jgi:ElaB/YqjD/DUF883 family membrane-anchored ribosome-binding protein
VDVVRDAGGSSLGSLQTTPDYVRENDVKAMAKDVEDLVRRYPGPALGIAAAVGFLVLPLVPGPWSVGKPPP